MIVDLQCNAAGWPERVVDPDTGKVIAHIAGWKYTQNFMQYQSTMEMTWQMNRNWYDKVLRDRHGDAVDAEFTVVQPVKELPCIR